MFKEGISTLSSELKNIFVPSLQETKEPVFDGNINEYANIIGETAKEICALYNGIFYEDRLDAKQVEKIFLIRISSLLAQESDQLREAEKDEQKSMVRKIIRNFKEDMAMRQKNLGELQKISNEMLKIIKTFTEEMDVAKKEAYPEHIILMTNKMREEHLSEGHLIEAIDYFQEKGESNAARRLKKLLAYEINFKKKAEEIIFGNESAVLPENFKTEIAADIQNYGPEITAENNGDHYLLAGVSKDLPKEGETRKKPIDALSYMFWMQNQEKNVKMIVCDTIQESNYQALYNLSSDEAREKALENGRRDKEWYNAVKNVFNLGRIEISDYQKLEQNPDVKRNLTILDILEKESPVFKKVFEAIIEKNVGEKVIGDKDSLTKYGKTEIALILSEDGVKIGHKKELRYDITARVISVYEELKDRINEIQELKNAENKEQALIDLSVFLAYQNNFPVSYHLGLDLMELNNTIESKKKLAREKGTDAKKQGEFIREKKELVISSKALQKEFLQAAKEFKEEKEEIENIEYTIKKLGLSENPRQSALKWMKTGKNLSEKEWFKELKLPKFYYPKQVTGLSFEMANEKTVVLMNFREFYSTIKGTLEEELPIEANQVVASTTPMAAAKLLVLSKEKQQHYFKKVLRPILVNYYLATSNSKEEAERKFTDDIKDIDNISEIVDFIQRKIIWPVEMEIRLATTNNEMDLRNESSTTPKRN